MSDMMSDSNEPSRPNPRRRTTADNPSPMTISGKDLMLRAALGLLSRATGQPLDELNLADLVVYRNYKKLLLQYATELGSNTAPCLHNLAQTLVVFARAYVKVDDQTQQRLEELEYNLRKACDDVNPPGFTKKNRLRLQQIGAPQLRALTRMPAVLMTNVLRKLETRRLSPQEIVDAQVACGVGVLLHVPIRAANLATIEHGRQLNLTTLLGGVSSLTFTKQEVKNDRDLTFELPEDVAELLRTFFYTIKPASPRIAHDNLLFSGLAKKVGLSVSPSKPAAAIVPRNGEKARSVIAIQMCARIEKMVGVRINEHLFRHLAAFLYLEQHPGRYDVVQLLLGHDSVETTKRFYCGLEVVAAVKHFHAVLKTIKDKAGVSPLDMGRMLPAVIPKKKK